MTNTDFHARRTKLSNTFAAAGAELLDYMRCAVALAAIPNTKQYVVAGDIAAIRAQLDTVAPQRRMRHGDRPEQPLYFGPEAGQARRWAALITSAGHGMLQEYGTKFEFAQPGQEVLEVMEILPGAPATANKAAEEGELPALDSAVMAWLETKDEPNKCCRESFFDGFRAADRASRQVANKAEVEPMCDFELKRLRRLLTVVGVAAVDELDGDTAMACFWSLIGSITNKLEATPPATTGASTARPEWDNYNTGHAEGLTAGRAAIEIHLASMEQNKHYRERVFNQILELDAQDGLNRFSRVGASTVLTDERQAFDKWFTDNKFGGMKDSMWAAWEARAEVAAQAGQVAVPEWISVDERLPDAGHCLATYRNRHGKLRIIRAKYARQYEIDADEDAIDQGNCEYNEADETFYLKAGWLECIDNWDDYSSIYVTEGEVTHWMPLPAAPSPAKESK